MLGAVEPERDFTQQDAVADRPWRRSPRCSVTGITIYRPAASGSTRRRTNPQSPANLLRLLTGRTPLERTMSAGSRRRLNHVRRTRVQRLDVHHSARHRGNALRHALRGDWRNRALAGPLHGGANEAALQLIERFRTPDEAATSVREMLARKREGDGLWPRQVPGAGSAVRDRQAVDQAAGGARAKTPIYTMLPVAIEELMAAEKTTLRQCGFLQLAGLSLHRRPRRGCFTTLFVSARVSGWCAPRQGAAERQQVDPPHGGVYRPRAAAVHLRWRTDERVPAWTSAEDDALFDVVDRLRPIALEQSATATGRPATCRRFWQPGAIVRLVVGVADSLARASRTRGNGLPKRPWTAISGRKAVTRSGKPSPVLLAEEVDPNW